MAVGGFIELGLTCLGVLQVPAYRVGFSRYTLPQLKIIQVVIRLSVYIAFVVRYVD